MAWEITIGMLIGFGAGLWFGYDFGHSRGFKAGRKDHAEGMKKVWKFVANTIEERQSKGAK